MQYFSKENLHYVWKYLKILSSIVLHFKQSTPGLRKHVSVLKRSHTTAQHEKKTLISLFQSEQKLRATYTVLTNLSSIVLDLSK